MRNYGYTITVALVVLFVLVIGTWQYGNWADCNDAGGDYVQGAFGYTCVGEDK